ncbi:hypothetical protein ABD73_15800 [Brevibacillus laterosporus]|nr:hypothetical protein [Brevibacillus laterosporus]
MTGINPGNISEILRNKRAMTIGHIDSFAKAFGYEAGWLYDLYAKEECIYDGKVSRARAVPCFPFCFCWIMNFKYPKSNTSAKSLLRFREVFFLVSLYGVSSDKEAVALVGLEQHHLISYAAKVDRVNKGAREPYLARTRKKGDKYQRELMELVDELIDLPDEQQKKSGLYGLLKKVMG